MWSYLSFLVVLFTMYGVNGAEDDVVVLTEARGHGKYALLTHLAFLLAAKAGLYKIVLGIALVIAGMKAIVVMAWALAIFKYAPDVWPTYKHADITYHGYDKYHDSTQGRPSNFLDYALGYLKPSQVLTPEAKARVVNMRTEAFFITARVHFFYAMVTKLVVLKIVYGFILFALLYKGWHFVLWFIHFLKEKKRDHEYIEFDHDFGHHDYGHHFAHHDYGHEPYSGHDIGSYAKDEYYPQYKKKGMYDADGSFSVKAS